MGPLTGYARGQGTYVKIELSLQIRDTLNVYSALLIVDIPLHSSDDCQLGFERRQYLFLIDSFLKIS